MANNGNTPKTMSSRLLTMKFMQRSAAATPEKAGQPPTKKQRLSNGSFASPVPSPRSDAKAVQEAMAAEEHKRAEALAREGANKGETKWYLSFNAPKVPLQDSPLRVISAGYSMLDSSIRAEEADSEEDEEELQVKDTAGRKSFGRFNRSIERQQDPDVSSSESDSEEDSGNDEERRDVEDDPIGVEAMINEGRENVMKEIRAERRGKRKAEEAKSRELANERRKKGVNLNRVNSISAAGNRRSLGSGRQSQGKPKPRHSY